MSKLLGLLKFVAGIVCALLAFTFIEVASAQAQGTFTVTNQLDGNAFDSTLSLHEAILVANGTLTTGFSIGEKSALGGCTFSSFTITGGCGLGITDTIVFSYSSGIITLTGLLPNLSDTRPTFIYGTNNSIDEIAIDGSNLAGGALLSVVSNGNVIWHLSFRNSASHGLLVLGNDNEVYFSRFYGNGGNGIMILNGDRNTLYYNMLGFRWLDNPISCNPSTRNDNTNILVIGTATSNVIQTNTSVCSALDGLIVSGNTATTNTITANYFGTWFNGGLRYLGNTNNGIEINSASTGNSIEYNIVANNLKNGIRLTGSGTSRNNVSHNDIGTYVGGNVPNSGAGVFIDSAASKNNILNNRLAYNISGGVYISGTNTDENWVEFNDIRNHPSAGVVLYAGASSNTVASNTIYANVYGVALGGSGTDLNTITRTQIYSNLQDGIIEGQGAGANYWQQVSIFNNGGLGVDRFAELDATNIISAPNISFTSINRTTKVVSGLSLGTVLFIINSVDLYRIALDPSGYGEGVTYVGSDTTDSNGNWSISDPGMTSGCYTAILNTAIIVPLGSSEFSHSSCRQMLPIVRKP